MFPLLCPSFFSMSSDGEKYLHFLVTKAHAVKFVDNIMSFHVSLIHRITAMLGVAKNPVTEDTYSTHL